MDIHLPPQGLNVNALGGAQAAGQHDSTAISGDLLMKLYELRMQYINGRLDAVVNQMEVATQRSKALNDLAAVLAKYPDGIDKDDPNAKAKWEEVNNAYINAEGVLPDGDPVQAQLEKDRTSGAMRFGSDGTLNHADGTPGDYVLGKGDVESLQKSVEGMQKQVDADNQKAGMVANMMMNQQNEWVSLITSMEQGRHQGAMAALGK